ncbi:feline leukemia virus subgroup C receptor-related protein 2 [Anastrepha obliqua]|uniref:feline leukemia virus subgroup C receptor-related protein 2 n=1 Tax=Anastrepha obliqua TaxID=95512 RepID=UPI0024097879|nr:feline leukemia virus subgroup C receptor-related protein 2 [Anastrepha obliqua]XP_054737470.1 feline leukemia virus subgroup C receptor-related protein 2 [Anastrepha obliqua]XP_054737471.1 feline leukemia virus subgroup C receptor-related protein 2 [Anastrepha obliqua]XP_054737473.1 feline leukemia virus subgroup C receptor-related protein 2 [Anastrepha obliqua]XP_054737474.1 feline leukemia virus subgroup C receptor-related protein 2 [Anastrepha obliqua]XP_054737475.1 feline leukemia viru
MTTIETDLRPTRFTGSEYSVGPGTDTIKVEEIKVYKRRWVVLFLFVFYSGSNAAQWIQYSIINNIIVKYYGINDKWVDWTSMVYMIVYIPLIFPGSWFLDKMGLRITALVGIVGTCMGSWIKVFSVQPDLFYVTFIGQTIVALSQVCVLSLPAQIAAVWFGPHQVSSACSVGVFGNQLGIAVGFVLPPILVQNSDDLDVIGSDLLFMFYCFAGFTTILMVLMILLFKDKPPTPPNPKRSSTAPSGGASEVPFMQSLKRLLINRNYILLLISYGMNVGVFYAISTLLNPVVLKYYPGHEVDTGRIGLSIVLAGMIGSVASGVVLDQMRKFKETTLAVYAFSMVGMWIFTFTLDTGHIAVVYVTAALLGFFMTGYLPVGFEFAAELTYPEPEGTSSGLLNAAAQVFGIGFTSMYSEVFYTYGDIPADVIMSIMLVLGTLITGFIKPDLRRQKANKENARPALTVSGGSEQSTNVAVITSGKLDGVNL